MAKSFGQKFQISVYMVCRFFFYLAYRVILRLKVVHVHNVPKTGPVIIAGNHKSYADPPLIGVCIPRIGHFLAKRSLFTFPPFGLILRLWNAHPTSREGGAEAIKLAVQLLAEGDAVIVFPEGTRIKGDGFGPPRAGVGMLAISTQTPVVPCYIHNTNKIFQLKKLTVIFGPAIYPENFPSYEKLAQKIMVAIAQLKESHF